MKPTNESLKLCPFCGGNPMYLKPPCTADQTWCNNPECRIYAIPMPRKNWQTRSNAEKENKQ